MKCYPAVLYVEDDEMSRGVMEILLTAELGLTCVDIFHNSENFAERIGQLLTLPDIIFLDIHMEPLDGFAMLDILRKHPKFNSQPVVALTASVMNEEIEQLKAAGFNGVIPKPIDLDTFPDLLYRLLDGEEVWRFAKTT